MRIKNKKESKKISEKKIFDVFFDEIWSQTESRNSGEHELWNHEMQGSPVQQEF